jgi:hypothetical protein
MSLIHRLHLAPDDDKDKKKDKDDSSEDEPPPPKKKKPPPPPPVKDDDKSDHDRMVGHLGVGWMGVSTIPLGMGTVGGTANAVTVTPGNPASIDLSAPSLGIRWWFNPTLGIDVGLGFAYSGGSTTAATGTTSTSTSKLGAFGMLIHGGVPIALAQGKHISLQITPETNIGFTHASVAPQGAAATGLPNATLSGVRFDLGARIGGEVHFGFIGIPELSLEGSIGAFFTYQSTGISAGAASYNDNSVGLTTASFNSPWDFFTSVVRARYYF